MTSRIKNKSRFVDMIVRIRKEGGWLQKELAAGVGMESNAWGLVESGKTRLTAEQLDKACEFLGKKVVIVDKKEEHDLHMEGGSGGNKNFKSEEQNRIIGALTRKK